MNRWSYVILIVASDFFEIQCSRQGTSAFMSLLLMSLNRAARPPTIGRRLIHEFVHPTWPASTSPTVTVRHANTSSSSSSSSSDIAVVIPRNLVIYFVNVNNYVTYPRDIITWHVIIIIITDLYSAFRSEDTEALESVWIFIYKSRDVWRVSATSLVLLSVWSDAA